MPKPYLFKFQLKQKVFECLPGAAAWARIISVHFITLADVSPKGNQTITQEEYVPVGKWEYEAYIPMGKPR